VWTRWLLVVPIGGLIVPGYSLLQPWFLRQQTPNDARYLFETLRFGRIRSV
jgi:hypothetical protein